MSPVVTTPLDLTILQLVLVTKFMIPTLELELVAVVGFMVPSHRDL
jgi:hypothetical protein